MHSIDLAASGSGRSGYAPHSVEPDGRYAHPLSEGLAEPARRFRLRVTRLQYSVGPGVGVSRHEDLHGVCSRLHAHRECWAGAFVSATTFTVGSSGLADAGLWDPPWRVPADRHAGLPVANSRS
jgi:hypothetical protein